MALPKYTVAVVLAIALIATLSAGVIVMNDAVGEMKKMNEPKGPTEVVWPPSPWQVDPNWPDSYPIDYTINWPNSYPVDYTINWPNSYPIDYTINWPNQYNIDWSESNPVSITYTKPSWADTVAEKLTLLGGKIYFIDAENFVVNPLINADVVAEDYMFVITQYPSEHEKETVYIPYEKIERIRFSEAI